MMTPEVLVGSAVMVMGIAIAIAYLIGKILEIFGSYKMFRKSGDAGWKAFIPFYSTYTRFRLFWDKRFYWIYISSSHF